MKYEGLSLLELIPAISPEHTSPWHMVEWANLIERSERECVRALCSYPIRHYKTETTLHGIIWCLIQDPTQRIVFLTYSFERAQIVGKRLRQLAEATDVGPTKGWNTIVEWRNEQGGGVVIMSADQSKIGYDAHKLVFDDPIDEHGADDPKKREDVDSTINHYTARCMRRGKPGSVIGVMSRFHPDDPIGRRLHRKAVKWEYIHQPAIVDEGLPTERAFAPDVWDLPALKAMRAELAEKDPTERYWYAQLMGDPRPVGTDLFRSPTYYERLPDGPYRICYGLDLAYSKADSADWCALTVGRLYGSQMYVLHAKRFKIDTHLIESECNAALLQYGRGTFFSYMSGPEIGTANVLRERGVPLRHMLARYNKHVRAERTIKRWNDGGVLLPKGGLWVPAFVHRVMSFRGNEKDVDDEVDALVSMCDGYMGGAVAGIIRTFGKAFT